MNNMILKRDIVMHVILGDVLSFDVFVVKDVPEFVHAIITARNIIYPFYELYVV